MELDGFLFGGYTGPSYSSGGGGEGNGGQLAGGSKQKLEAVAGERRVGE